MKHFVLVIGLVFLSFAGAAQQTKKLETKKAAVRSPTPTKKTQGTTRVAKKPAAKPKATVTAPPKKDEKAELETANAIENPERKVAALEKFLVDFPKTESRILVLEALTAARVSTSEAKFEAGERETALKFARAAVDEAPVPYSEKLFSESISKVPSLLFSRGEAAAAYEIAAAIEKNSVTSAPQLLGLASFYLSHENSADAKRLAEAALKIDEKSAAAYQTLGLANRLHFDLESAAAAYEKAVDLEPDAVSARKSLAEMKRALGKPDEALAIFTSLIEKDPTDVRSVNGRILALFDAGKRADAESELARAIESDPANFVLIAGAAYWYAANGEYGKAIDLSGKAISIEPRYVWSHIALARALAGDARYTDAEQVLLKARQYGNFPTLDYAIAAVRYSAGFYREAVEELQKSFAIKDGLIVTKLGRRVERSEKNFTDLLAGERRASILEAKAADNPDTADKLRSLLEFSSTLAETIPDETKAADAATAFAAGSDKMRFYRQIYAANELLEHTTAPSKAFELSKAAIASSEDGLSVPLPAAPIMASELYASRRAAIAADKYVLVPDVPKQTLSAISRGRIEEIAGTALIQQKNYVEAAIRLRRAISVLPENSAWWRTSLWRLGGALEVDGKDKEALDAYVKSYAGSDPDAVKYAVIENIYKRVNNNIDGLDALIGANPAKPVEKVAETAAATTADTKTEAPTEVKADVPADTKPESVSEKKNEGSVEKTAGASASPLPVSGTVKIGPSPSPGSEVKKTDDAEPAETNSVPLEVQSSKPADASEKTDQTKPKPEEDPPVKPPEADRKPVEKKETDQNIGSVPKPDEKKPPETKPESKPMFEPVVIEVRSGKSTKADAGSNSSDPAPPDIAYRKTTKTQDTADPTGATRPRVVVTDPIPPCVLSVSQENISLIGGGGSVAILVGVDKGDVKEIKFASSSPRDIEVVAEPETAGVSGRALYVVRSLTDATGIYQVNFSLPCGTKEVLVRVR